MKQSSEKYYYFISPAVILTAWEILARMHIIDIRFFPLPSVILITIFSMIKEGILLQDLLVSLTRVMEGILLGGIPGIAVGILLAKNRIIRILLKPLVDITFPIPKIAVIPFVILFFGMGEISKVIIIGLGAFYYICLNTYFGVRNINKIYYDISRVYNYLPKDIFVSLIFKGALPYIYNGLKLSVGACFMLVVAAEFIGSTSGIGYRIWISWETFQIPEMFAALIILAATGFFVAVILEKLENRLFHWKQYSENLNSHV